MNLIPPPNNTYHSHRGYFSELLSFSNPTADRIYIKFLQYISAHPGCSRNEILNAVKGEYRRGFHSTTFRFLHGWQYICLYRDGRRVRYYITDAGKNLIRLAMAA